MMKYLTNISAPKGSAVIAYLLFFAIICAFPAYAVSSATFEEPTASDNATTFLNWTYINITSSENLTQSLLEWGNASGVTNFTMLNESGSMQNWYLNMTNLTDGTYNYTIWMENTTGEWSQSERKNITVDTIAPYNVLACQDLTAENGNYVLVKNVYSAGTCFTIKANNVTLEGAGYSINYSQSVEGYAINNSRYNRTTIKNLTIVQGGAISSSYAIYGAGIADSTITNNSISTIGDTSHGILIDASNTNNISNNNITTSGDNVAVGIFLDASSNTNTISGNNITSSGNGGIGIGITGASGTNTVSNNRVTTSGADGYGINIALSSTNNVASNNTILTSGSNGFGIYILSASSNNITGGSIIASQSAAYSVQNASNTNKFTNTNFTALRNITFFDSTSYFNYNNQTNGNIWLKTNISLAGSINRTLVNWTNHIMQWNDTNSTSDSPPGITANYIITGLSPNANYRIYNTSSGIQTNTYNRTTDANGDLSAFAIALNGSTEIKVVEGTPVVTIHSPANGAIVNYIPYINGTVFGTNIHTIKTNSTNHTSLDTDGAPFNFTNQSYLPDGTYTINISANDTDGNVGWANVTFTMDTVSPAFTTDPAHSTVTSGSAYISWTPNGETNATLRYGASTLTYSFSSNAKNISIPSLAASTTYYYNVTICDQAGNCVMSSTSSFTTSASDSSSSSTTTSSGGGSTSSTVKNWASIASGSTATMTVSSTSIYVTQIDVTVKQAVSNAKLSVSRFTSKPAGTATAPEGSAYQYLSITPENLPESKISDASITFKVSTKWMSDNNIDSAKVTLYRYSGGAWNALPTYSAKGSTSEYTNYVADTPGFSYFAIVGKAKTATSAPAPKTNTTNTTASGNGVGNQNSANLEDNSTQNASTQNNTATDESGSESSSSIFLIIAVLLIVAVAAYYLKTKQPTKWKTEGFKSGETKPEDKKSALIQLPKPQYNYKFKPQTKNAQMLNLIKESVNAPKKKIQHEQPKSNDGAKDTTNQKKKSEQ